MQLHRPQLLAPEGPVRGAAPPPGWHLFDMSRLHAAPAVPDLRPGAAERKLMDDIATKRIARRCKACGRALDGKLRRDAQTCNDTCKKRLQRRRRFIAEGDTGVRPDARAAATAKIAEMRHDAGDIERIAHNARQYRNDILDMVDMAARDGFARDELEPSWSRGDWMQTFSGRRFYPLDPRPEDIEPGDIAHALSLICRYAGHVSRFYSVAEHCVLMSRSVAPEHALAALLHDATEAYLVDVPRPLKLHLPDYRRIEANVWTAIAWRFNVDLDLPADVHEADTRILVNETAVLMANREAWASLEGIEPLAVTVAAWSPWRAKREYLQRLRELGAIA